MKKMVAPPVVSDINVTPMVDVMLVLLIIFMVITPMLQHGVTVEMVKAKNVIAMKDADKEDAVLIGELLGTDGAVPVLFEEFMARRYRRCQYVVETSRQIGDWEMESWRGINNANADPGGLLHRAQLALLDEY